MKKLCTSILILGAFLTVTGTAYAQFKAELSGAQVLPPPGVNTVTTGKIEAIFDEAYTDVLIKLEIVDLAGSNPVTAIHLHCDRPGHPGDDVITLFPGNANFNFDGRKGEGTLTNTNFSANTCNTDADIGRNVNNIVALAFAMRDGLIYVDVHTTANPNGLIRGQLSED